MADKNVNADGDYEGRISWPAWYYGPNGQSEIFNSEEEVPEGWHDHPSKTERKAKKPAEPKESPYKNQSDAEVIAELKKRKLDYNERWPRDKLEGLLIEDDKKAK